MKTSRAGCACTVLPHAEASHAGTSHAGSNLRTTLHHQDDAQAVRLPLWVLEILNFVLDGVHADGERRTAKGARQRFKM